MKTKLKKIDELFEQITPLPFFVAADGSGIGLAKNRWTNNGAFQNIMRPSVKRHGGSHKANMLFMAELTNMWPEIRSYIETLESQK